MLTTISIHDDFISVGISSKWNTSISKYAHAILPEHNYEKTGMSGYDVDDFIKYIVQNSSGFENVLEKFTFDSEYSMFCMYYNTNDKSIVTQDDINNCMSYVKIINNLIMQKYIQAVSKIDTSINIADLRKK